MAFAAAPLESESKDKPKDEKESVAPKKTPFSGKSRKECQALLAHGFTILFADPKLVFKPSEETKSDESLTVQVKFESSYGRGRRSTQNQTIDYLLRALTELTKGKIIGSRIGDDKAKGEVEEVGEGHGKRVYKTLFLTVQTADLSVLNDLLIAIAYQTDLLVPNLPIHWDRDRDSTMKDTLKNWLIRLNPPTPWTCSYNEDTKETTLTNPNPDESVRDVTLSHDWTHIQLKLSISRDLAESKDLKQLLEQMTIEHENGKHFQATIEHGKIVFKINFKRTETFATFFDPTVQSAVLVEDLVRQLHAKIKNVKDINQKNLLAAADSLNYSMLSDTPQFVEGIGKIDSAVNRLLRPESAAHAQPYARPYASLPQSRSNPGGLPSVPFHRPDWR